MKKLLLLLFGKRYLIKKVEWLKDDEIIIFGHRLYIKFVFSKNNDIIKKD